MDRLGLEAELLQEFVVSLVERSRGMVADIAEALAAGDLSRAEGLAHSIKGAAATFEANELAETARRFEALAREGSRSACEPVWRELSAAVEQLAAAL